MDSPTVTIADIVGKAAVVGVAAVIDLMVANAENPEYQWWCCDALTGLCAGSEENRAAVFVKNGIVHILTATRLFLWDESVQTKANWALANLAATYAEYIGKKGGVESVVAGMTACAEAYQVQISGTRCLQNLIHASPANLHRAKAAGAIELLKASLEANPEDGQLQWRGAHLLAQLEAAPEEAPPAAAADADADAAATAAAAAAVASPVEAGRSSNSKPWSKSKSPELASLARTVAEGQVPGQHGASAVVAEAAQRGIAAVLELLRTRGVGNADIAMWCFDAVATLITGNAENREAAHAAGIIPLLETAMAQHLWNEAFCYKACWALLALAPAYSLDIGAAGIIHHVIVCMHHNKTNHDLQVSCVKLLSLLTLEPTNVNIERARAAHAVQVVLAVIAAHTDDGQLQYRGINLLERLEPGCTTEVPKVNLIRSASMQAEELVLHSRSMARIASRKIMSQELHRALSSEQIAANKAAISEVDEMAEHVEGDDEDDGAAAAHHPHHHGSSASSTGGAAAPATLRRVPTDGAVRVVLSSDLEFGGAGGSSSRDLAHFGAALPAGGGGGAAAATS